MHCPACPVAGTGPARNAPPPPLRPRRYERTSAEALAASGAQYHLVVASEVIEHVRQPPAFMRTLASLVAPGGQLVVSTLNRTPRSFALAIAAAEYVLRMVPPGTHDWARFVTPQELAMMGADAGLSMQLVGGLGSGEPCAPLVLPGACARGRVPCPAAAAHALGPGPTTPAPAHCPAGGGHAAGPAHRSVEPGLGPGCQLHCSVCGQGQR